MYSKVTAVFVQFAFIEIRRPATTTPVSAKSRFIQLLIINASR